jgi:hypothetical protein
VVRAFGCLQRAVPGRLIDIDRADLDPVVAGVAHQLGGVEAHGLGIEDGRQEDIWVVAFHPAGGIGDQGKAGRMGFRKSVAAKALQLAERAIGEFLGVAVVEYAGDQLLLKCIDAACMLERRHGAAQLIGLRGSEAGSDHRHLHRLFLKQWHAERLAQHLLKGWGREVHISPAGSAAVPIEL